MMHFSWNVDANYVKIYSSGTPMKSTSAIQRYSTYFSSDILILHTLSKDDTALGSDSTWQDRGWFMKGDAILRQA